jgi:predicted acetyltransferase
MNTRLVLVTPETQHILENFFTPYFFEMSRYDKKLPMNAHGLPIWEDFGGVGPTTHAECVRYNWWIRDETENFLIYVEDLPAGFVLLLRESEHLPPDVKTELVDFYIAPRYRGAHVGTDAARLALTQYNGNWALFTLKDNLPARKFWRRVLENDPHIQNLEVDTHETQWFFTRNRAT